MIRSGLSPVFLSRPSRVSCVRPISLISRLQPATRRSFRTSSALLAEATARGDPVYQKKIAEDIKSAPVVLYMKGTPDQPMCGFSKAAAMVLTMHNAKFKAFNVLEDQKLREEIKIFTDWPTIPQIFIGGEFVGGCDILLNLHRQGELEKMLRDAGALVEAPQQAEGTGDAQEGKQHT